MQTLRVQTFILVAVAFLLGCNEFIVVGILSDISREFHVPVAAVGFLVTLFALVYAISTPIITIFIAKYNRLTSLLVLMVIFILSNTYSGLAPSYSQLVVSRIITALTAGVIISLVMSFSTVIAPAGRRAHLIAWIFSGFSIASVFGVPLGTFISTTWGWRYSFYTITGVSVLIWFLMLFSLPGKMEQVHSTLLGQLKIMKDGRIFIGVLLPLFGSAASYVVYTYLRPILTQQLQFPLSWLSLLLFVYGGMSIISNQLSGKLAERDGLARMPFVYACECIIFIALPLMMQWSWPGLLDLMLVGVTMYLLNAPIQIHFLTVAERDYPQSAVFASSLNSIFFNLGISLGSATGSVIVAKAGMYWLGPAAALYALMACSLTIYLNHLRSSKVGVSAPAS